MSKTKLHTIATLCIDVAGLRDLIVRMSVDNAGGCNDNPVMFELCQQLCARVKDWAAGDGAVKFHRDVPCSVLARVDVDTCLSDQAVHPCMFTVADLLGWGVFTHDSESEARSFRDDLVGTFGRDGLASEDCMRLVCQRVISYAVPDCDVGVQSYQSQYTEIMNTGYSVPSASENSVINKAYLAMATDGFYQFNMMVLPYIKIFTPMDEYLISNKDAE